MNKTYSIKEMAMIAGITPHTLRYYEKIDLLPNISRDKNGYRRYSQSDVEWVSFLLQLKATGMPLAQMQLFAQLRSQGDHTGRERRKMLKAHRRIVVEQIERLNECLTMIDFKIERHRQTEKSL